MNIFDNNNIKIVINGKEFKIEHWANWKSIMATMASLIKQYPKEKK